MSYLKDVKIKKEHLHTQRQILDQKPQLSVAEAKLKNGWIRAVRTALGLSGRQLAQRLGVTPANIQRLEDSEQKKTISLQSLSRAAEAMDCELVYMFVPKAPAKSFDEILSRRSLALAAEIASGVSHSMALEDQKVSSSATDTQIQDLAHTLKQDLDPRLWPFKKTKAK